MTDTELNDIANSYLEILSRQQFDDNELDYSTFDKNKATLRLLATVGNSGISVFDMNKQEHIFYSPNFGASLGYDVKEIEENGNRFLDAKIHPEDFVTLMKNGISILKFFYDLPTAEKTDYKFLSEYRILNNENVYIRVLEQHQVLELDTHGNVWLTLSTIDVSPNQSVNENVNCQLHNFKTGEMIPFSTENINQKAGNTILSKREIEILHLIKDGFLSKEISEKLDLSVHTVNTHRQRLLEKLKAKNSMEAIAYASKLGLIVTSY